MEYERILGISLQSMYVRFMKRTLSRAMPFVLRLVFAQSYIMKMFQ
jgi:hypothetical protein